MHFQGDTARLRQADSSECPCELPSAVLGSQRPGNKLQRAIKHNQDISRKGSPPLKDATPWDDGPAGADIEEKQEPTRWVCTVMGACVRSNARA
eukprot:8474291-Alexandrium_andersonii.AAC.1